MTVKSCLSYWKAVYLSKQCKSPCIYTFCGGSCALFSANGYRLLLNGGKKDESVFWRYVTHVPRLDAIIGNDAIWNNPRLSVYINFTILDILKFHLNTEKLDNTENWKIPFSESHWNQNA